MRRDAELETIIAVKYSAIADALGERGQRLWAALESSAVSYYGYALVSDATSLARATIRRGCEQIESGTAVSARLRIEGAGRPDVEHS